MVAEVNPGYVMVHKQIMWDIFHMLSTRDWNYGRTYRTLDSFILYTPSVQVINKFNLKSETPVSCVNKALLTLSLRQKNVSTAKGYMIFQYEPKSTEYLVKNILKLSAMGWPTGIVKHAPIWPSLRIFVHQWSSPKDGFSYIFNIVFTVHLV
jgi:hypothetical protein